MKATRKQISEANRIAGWFGGYRTPKDFRAMYDALEAIGVTVDVITNRSDDFSGGWSGSTTWSIHGEEVENSRFILSVYEGSRTAQNDYNPYFS